MTYERVRTTGVASLIGLSCLFLAGSAQASIWRQESVALDLINSTVTVTYDSAVSGGSSSVTGIVEAVGGAGDVGISNSLFTFGVTAGDTFLSTWSLSNNTGLGDIVEISIDLTTATPGEGKKHVAFDDNSTPSSPLSGVGVLGASILSGPAEVASAEFSLIDSPDMYRGETISWNPDVFTQGLTYEWHDDTDVVPVPGSIALLGLGLVLLKRTGRR